MALDRTHVYKPIITDDATLQQVQDIVDGINDLKDNAVDITTGEINASSVTIDADAVASGDRSLIFKLTGSLSRLLKYKDSTGRMRLENQAGALVGLEVADASQSTQAATFGQLTTARLKTVVSKSANYTLAAGDQGEVISCTSTFTLALDPAATLGNGWHCEFRNDGTGAITIDPNGAETIDGKTSIIAYPGEAFGLRCTGTSIITVGRQRSGLILLDSQTASNNTVIDFTKFITADFDEYVLKGQYVLPATDNVSAYLRASTDGGATFLAGTTYAYHSNDTTGSGASGTGSAQITLNRLGIGNADGEGIGFEARIIKPAGAQVIKSMRLNVDYRNTSSGDEGNFGTAIISNASPLNAFRFLFSSGNVSSGNLKLYGERA